MDLPFSTLIIDEAHLVGDWGASIRPQFLLLGIVRDVLTALNPALRIIVQSATITLNEDQELRRLFSANRMRDLPTVRENQVRDDLHFRILRISDDNFIERAVQVVFDEASSRPNKWKHAWDDRYDTGSPPFIVYSATKDVARVHLLPKFKQKFGEKSAAIYDGDTKRGSREKLRLTFKENKVSALIATSAFGMGIDKPDIWYIAYVGLPHTLKGLYQGFGRAARGSNWSKTTSRESLGGVCSAIIPTRGPRPFRSELGVAYAAERAWDIIQNSTFIEERGLLISPILSQLHEVLWKQTRKDLSVYIQRIRETAKDQDDDEWDVEMVEQAKKNMDLGASSTIETNTKYMLWSLALLQRNDSVKIHGFSPKYCGGLQALDLK